MIVTHRFRWHLGVPQSQQDAIEQPMPMHHLIPLAGLDARIDADQLGDPIRLERTLRRIVLARLIRGELCMIPAWRASAYGMPMVDIPGFLRHHEGDRVPAP